MHIFNQVLRSERQRRTAVGGLVVYLAVTAALRAAMPGMPLVWVGVMWLIAVTAVLAYGRTRACTWQGMAVMYVAATLVSAGVIADVWYYTVHSGGTDSAPVLLNPDVNRHWSQAVDFLESPAEWFMNIRAFSYVPAAVMWVFGYSISACCLISMAFLMTSLVQVAVICRRLGLSRRQCTAALIVMTCLCYWMSMGCTLLKDAMSICAILLAARSMLKARPGALMLVAALMGGLARPPLCGMMVLGLVLTFPFKAPDKGRVALVRLVWAGVCLLPWYAANHMGVYTSPADYAAVQELVNNIYVAPQHYAYYELFGNTGTMPLWQRVLMLPLSACVQMLVPFPWNWLRDLEFGPSFVYAHFAYPRYIFEAIFIFFVFMSRDYWRRYSSDSKGVTLYMLAVWGLLCWLSSCVIYGGTVSRYGLSAVALMAPAVVVCLSDYGRRRAFRIWLAVFAVTMLVVLCVAYRLQMSALNGPNPLA